jgi:valyl-tRNA synthetase
LFKSPFQQDPDVLDTWFSSALWPLSTMGWPDSAQSPNTAGLLEAFNPTSVLSTAREIITLWVSRMVMMNRFLLGDGGGQGPVPFRDVFIHAVVQDGEGRKMSKSLGNGVDPLDIIDSHGADAMRFVLCQMTTQTQDVRMPVVKDSRTGKNTSPKFDLGRNFCNKLWNASRFAIGMLPKESAGDRRGTQSPIDAASLSLVDRWMLSRLATTTRQVDGLLKNYEFSDYAEAMYRLLWWDVCDWYLEAIKPTVASSPAQQAVLAHALEVVVRLLHPITPFVTEAVWEQLRSVETAPIAGIELGASRTGLLCTAGWPRLSDRLIDAGAEKSFESLRELVSAIRNARSEHQVPPKRRIILHATPAATSAMALAPGLVETLAGIERVEAGGPASGVASVIVRAMGEEMRLSNLADAIDAGAEKERLSKQLEALVKSEAALAGRLNNPGYAERAPAKLVEESRAQLVKIQGEIAAVRQRLGAL